MDKKDRGLMDLINELLKEIKTSRKKIEKIIKKTSSNPERNDLIYGYINNVAWGFIKIHYYLEKTYKIKEESEKRGKEIVYYSKKSDFKDIEEYIKLMKNPEISEEEFKKFSANIDKEIKEFYTKSIKNH